MTLICFLNPKNPDSDTIHSVQCHWFRPSLSAFCVAVAWGKQPQTIKIRSVGKKKRNRCSRQGGQGRFSNRVSHEQRPICLERSISGTGRMPRHRRCVAESDSWRTKRKKGEWWGEVRALRENASPWVHLLPGLARALRSSWALGVVRILSDVT